MSDIPPWQDLPTLSANLSTAERTIEGWVKQGILPPPRTIGGKRLWKWADVEAYLEGRSGAATSPDELAARIRNDARSAKTAAH